VNCFHCRFESGGTTIERPSTEQRDERRASAMSDHDVSHLRDVIQDLLDKHMYSSAVFFADKLVALADATPADVYLLAQAHFVAKHYRAAGSLLRAEGLVDVDPRFKYLAARCAYEIGDMEGCIETLGNNGAAVDTEMETSDEEEKESVSVLAAMETLRGRAYDALDNRSAAKRCYADALRKDPYCYEAFEQLVANHLMTVQEHKQLLAELSFSKDNRWLKLLYEVKAGRYAGHEELEARMSELECPHNERVGGRPGCGLNSNADVLAARAEWLFYSGDFRKCYDITMEVMQSNPFEKVIVPIHLAVCVELKQKNELFLVGHRLVEEFPSSGLSWYAVGCYYLAAKMNDSARRYFSKATVLDSKFAPAWIGFGHAFAAQDESDQAMAAYRTASRLFPGCHIPVMCIGMEYMRTNNLPLAEQLLLNAKSVCPLDPMIYNELGVLYFRNGDYNKATRLLREALKVAPKPLAAMWEPILVNLAHSLRKQGLYIEACIHYKDALALSCKSASTFAALGFTKHLQDNLPEAIEMYHKALSLRPEDTLTAELLNEALLEDCSRHRNGGDLL